MLKIRQARPFFLKGNRNFSSGRPHQKIINHNLLKCLKIGEARPFFLQGNRDFSSGRPHQKFINHNFVRAQRGKFLNTSLILHEFS